MQLAVFLFFARVRVLDKSIALPKGSILEGSFLQSHAASRPSFLWTGMCIGQRLCPRPSPLILESQISSFGSCQPQAPLCQTVGVVRFCSWPSEWCIFTSRRHCLSGVSLLVSLWVEIHSSLLVITSVVCLYLWSFQWCVSDCDHFTCVSLLVIIWVMCLCLWSFQLCVSTCDHFSDVSQRVTIWVQRHSPPKNHLCDVPLFMRLNLRV